jgi:hypothetical protein
VVCAQTTVAGQAVLLNISTSHALGKTSTASTLAILMELFRLPFAGIAGIVKRLEQATRYPERLRPKDSGDIALLMMVSKPNTIIVMQRIEKARLEKLTKHPQGKAKILLRFPTWPTFGITPLKQRTIRKLCLC